MKTLYLTIVILLLITTKSLAQNKLTITGGNCEGTIIKAHTQGNKLVQLRWAANNIPVDTTTIDVPYFKEGTTVAGGNGAGEAANQFYYPHDVFVNNDRNIYIADNRNNRIQKWSPGATEGVTVAGGNGAGSAPNQLNFPTAVIVDNFGNIYVSDNNNSRVQKWIPGATEGITIAGGNGFGSALNQLNNPVGLFIDSEGALYIADVDNNRIQRWLPGAAEGITVAGGRGRGDSANQLYRPYDIYLDSLNNLYIADEGNYRVQKWSAGAAEGITIAGGNGSGSASNQLEAPQFLSVDKLSNVFISDLTNNRVQKWAPGASEGITVAGSSEGSFGSSPDLLNGARGIFLDKEGKLYVTDLRNNRIQLFLPDSAHEALPDSTYADNTGGIYRATASFYNSSDAVSNKLAVTSLPRFTNINGQKRNLCGGGNFTYSVPAIQGASDYRWAVPKGFTILSGQGTASITVNIPSSGFSSGSISVNEAKLLQTLFLQNLCVLIPSKDLLL